MAAKIAGKCCSTLWLRPLMHFTVFTCNLLCISTSFRVLGPPEGGGNTYFAIFWPFSDINSSFQLFFFFHCLKRRKMQKRFSVIPLSWLTPKHWLTHWGGTHFFFFLDKKWRTLFKRRKIIWKRPQKVFLHAMGFVLHPKSSQNTQQCMLLSVCSFFCLCLVYLCFSLLILLSFLLLSPC